MAKQFWLMDLNAQQYAAVTAPLGHMMVLAGAGSGKTRVLVSRMAWLIEHEQVLPAQMMAVTFTNKAAHEMKTRLSQALSCSVAGLWVGTFHGLCHRLLRKHHDEAHLPQSFHILDPDDQIRILKRVMNAMNLDLEQWPPKQVMGFINARKDEGLRAANVAVPAYGPMRMYASIYAAYEKLCQDLFVIDFAELILRTLELLRDNDVLRQHYQQTFKVILVDEFQDTNTIQYALIRLLAGDAGIVMAVGDDDQSIYGWRGAKIENMRRFQTDFSSHQLIRLEQNYRSTATILNAANALIAHNASRLGKDLWTEDGSGEKITLYSAMSELEEAYFVGQHIQHQQSVGRQLKDIAVLYRSNAQSRVIEEAFIRAQIAYRIHGGMRYFERAEVKDVLAYLRLIVNPHDDTAFERVLNVPARGIGERTLETIVESAKVESCSLWQSALHTLNRKILKERASNALTGFLTLITRLAEKQSELPLHELIEYVMLHSGLQQLYTQIKGDLSDSKLANLQELVNAASEFRQENQDLPDLVAFLAHASLGFEQDHSEEEGSVQLMTLHAAKGLEFPVVFMVGLEEGIFPSKMSHDDPKRLEEERRLCYVGMTRAMKKLYLSYAQSRRLYGRSEYHRPSRFLRELPETYLHRVETFATPNQTKTILKHQDGGLPSIKKHPFLHDTHATYRIGQAVTHPKFGQGVIIDLEGHGSSLKAHVRFQKNETKWLMVAYAKLITLEFPEAK